MTRADLAGVVLATDLIGVVVGVDCQPADVGPGHESALWINTSRAPIHSESSEMAPPLPAHLQTKPPS